MRCPDAMVLASLSLRTGLLVLVAAISLCVAAQPLPPPEVAARAYLLMDVSANQVLAAKDVDLPVEPASLTKLMTAYLVFNALRSKQLDLQQTLPVSERAWKMPGSRMSLTPRMLVPVNDLIKGMIVQSANDATMALAEGVGGSAEHFVDMMNAQAKVLGLQATTYKNPEGSPAAGHLTTARDLGTLAARLVADFPERAEYFAIKKYHYPDTPAANDSSRNLLLFRDPSVDGLAAGYTETAGYCLVATARRDVAGGSMPNGTRVEPFARRLLAIVLGAASDNARANESQRLLNWGFTAYESVKLFDAEQAVAQSSVWKGVQPSVKLGRFQPIVVAVPTGSAPKLKTQVVRTEPLVAPLAKNQSLGSLKVIAGDQTVAEVPLVALEAVEQAGLLGRAWDALRLWIR